MDIIRTKLGNIKTYQDEKLWYSAKDVANILDYRGNLTKVIRQNGNYKFIKCNTNGGVQKLMFIDFENLKLTLIKRRLSSSIELAKELNIQLDCIKPVIAETQTLGVIINCLKHRYEVIHHHGVGKYRVDAYVKDKNIIIECDENDHKTYDKDEELKRTNYINQTLNNPKWLRYNPATDCISLIIKEFI